MAHKHLKNYEYLKMIKKNDYVGLVKYHNELANAAKQLNDVEMENECLKVAKEYTILAVDWSTDNEH